MTHYQWSGQDPRIVETIAHTRLVEQARELLGQNLSESAVIEGALAEIINVGRPVAVGPWLTVTDPAYGATGDLSADDTDAIKAADAAAWAAGGLGVNAKVYFPVGKYKTTGDTVPKSQVGWFGDGPLSSTIVYYPSGTGTSGFTMANAASGQNGNFTIRDLAFQLADQQNTTTAWNLTAGAPYTIFDNCRFINWTKYAINASESVNFKVRDCYFDGIVGNSATGDIGTAIYTHTAPNVTQISGNTFIRCDRGVQVTGSAYAVVINFNIFEKIGYKSGDVDNSQFSNYYAVVADDIKSLTAIGNYFEAIRLGDPFNISGIRGGMILCNTATGEEPSALGGDVVMRRFITCDDYQGLTVRNNNVIEYTDTKWAVFTTGGSRPAVDGLDVNFITDAAVSGLDPIANATVSGMQKVSADRGDAGVTLVAGTDAPIQRFDTTLTDDRTVTLSTTGARNGDAFRIVRTGLGAKTLAVGSLKTIANSTAAFVDVVYNGSAWTLAGYGTL